MKKLPKVTIVGFPNVGKSTLFNRLLRRKRALVHSLPGMTRDSVTAPCRLDDRDFMLTDTGGFFGLPDEPLSSQVREKAWRAVTASDLVIYLLDGKRDLAPAEEEFYASLRKLGKPLLVVVNKMDSPAQEDRLGEFYRLGEEKILSISAEHNIGLGNLTEAILSGLPPSGTATGAVPGLRIAIVGRINVGKSSLINRLCGEDKLLVSEIPGTTRDSTDTLVVREKKSFVLVDTAGIRKMGGTRDEREKAGIIRAKRDIREADVICLVLDVQEFPTRQDAHIAHLACASGKPLIIALNKWDLVDASRVKPGEVRRKVYERLEFVDYAPLLFISAATGQRVVKILSLAEDVHQMASKKIETSRLNQFLARVNREYPPRSKSRGRIKIKYMTQQGIRPPAFVLFAHGRAALAPAYEKFLTGLLRKEFDIWGTPIRLFLRKG
ncbi:MAG: ribosome biogenesis GTPase Der [Acidobacteriota bacterium]|nr:ribosome biogenesis GTPase Der [Acidobacteriota bacterium]